MDRNELKKLVDLKTKVASRPWPIEEFMASNGPIFRININNGKYVSSSCRMTLEFIQLAVKLADSMEARFDPKLDVPAQKEK